VLFTCAAVWSCEVLRGEVNHPRINGKDAVAGSITSIRQAANCQQSVSNAAMRSLTNHHNAILDQGR
jgi:hypothetical protein